MNIQEVEALSVEELKARREELAEDLSQESRSDISPKMLAARYLKHLIAAKIRDEKLAEQGKTITLLQESLDAAREFKASADAAMKELQDATTDAQRLYNEDKQRLEDALSDLRGSYDALKDMLREQDARGGRLKAQAEAYADAITSISKIALDAINTRAIEDAVSGEE
jgi:hypothetical protein